MKKLCSSFVRLSLLLAAGCIVTSAGAATVGSGGYTNDFSGLLPPTVADWSTLSIGAAGTDFGDAPAVAGAVTNLAAGSINSPVGSDVGNPPAANALAYWSSTGLYLQTKPTGNGATLLMCKLVNGLPGEAIGVTVSYDQLTSTGGTADQVPGHRAFYSLSGAAGSWTSLPQFSGVADGKLTASLSINWPSGSTVYIVWADDNADGGTDNDIRIDNFSATATPGTHTPVAITSHPQSQTVPELQPVTFTASASGYPSPTWQWYRDDVAINGATNGSYAIASALLSDSGAQFKVVAANTASNVNYAVTSSVAVLTVNADTIAPTLVRAIGVPPGTVSVDFSEAIRADAANIAANYAITSALGSLTISNAVLQPNGSNVVLITSAQSLGTTYTLIVNNIRDISSASNQIAPNSTVTFTTVALVLTDIGSPSPAGSINPSGNGYDITAGGSDIGGTTDQFTFDYQTLPGDFDVKVRLAGLSLADVWTKAGLMARETLGNNTRYAASFTTPGSSGSFFQYRTTVGAVATSIGSFPATYPNAWLRLKRAGNVFSGFASLDGNNWSSLGSVTIAGMPGTLFVGLAVTSRTNGVTTTAQFRDFMDVLGNPPAVSVPLPREPLGPSSRKTGFSITEIMYHPRTVPGFTNRSLEFVEIHNSNPFFESIGSHRLSGAIDYVFPANTVVKGGGFVVVARDPGFVQSHYGISGVLGPWAGTNMAGMSTNGLPGGSGTLRLRNPADAVMLEVNYSGGAPYPVAADGAGHSLTLNRASYGEGDARAWAASDAIDGSPGRDDPYSADTLRNVVLNEFLAHTDDPLVDYLELYNHANTPVDLSGAYLADEADFIQNPSVTNHFYRFPNGTSIPARGFISVDQTALGFSLSASGERIYLVNSNQTRVIDSLAYQAQQNGVSMGRSPDGASAWYRMNSRTPGLPNSAPRQDAVVINEIMYAPITGKSDDEYVELYNRSGVPVNVGNWRFVDGIDFTIPPGTIIGSNGYLVVVRSTNIFAKYPNLSSANAVGGYNGTLGNGGERIALAMPDVNVTTNNGVLVTNNTYVTVNEVTYGDGGRWGFWTDGGGSSLELRDPYSDNRQAANWADSDESAKGIWTTIEGTNAISETLGSPVNDALYIFQLGIGECLVDDVEVKNNGGANANSIITNPGFESGTAGPGSAGVDLGGWTAQGSHDHSTFENTGFTGSRSLHLRTAARGDNGGNRVRSPALSPAASGNVLLRARVKWVRGWPEILLRLRGGGLEVGGRLPMQPNLGTPGLPNSRLLPNIGPAVYEVAHSPILPAANEPVVVTARVTDPDPSVTLRLKFRVDPATTYTAVTMTDDGTNGTSGDAIAGDGIFSATILGRAANTVVPFYLEAVDGLGATNTFPTDVFPTAPMTRIFPLDATTRECVLRWGDTLMPGSFSTYHVWLTAANTARWNQRRPVLCNAPLDATFVYNNSRVIYNIRPQFAGSPWHRGSQNQGPDGGNRCDYDIEYPEDDKFLGSTDAVWNNPGNPGGTSTSDTSAQTEQTTYLVFKELRIHYNYRRYMHVFVNGNQRSTTSNRSGNFIFEDSQQANSEVISEWSSDDTDGQLFKIEDWFEFPDNGDDFTANNDADLVRRTIVGTTNFHLGATRFMFRNRARGAGESANDYTNFVNLMNIVSPAGVANTTPLTNQLVQFGAIADYEQWMRSFACQHAVGNWDSYGYQRGKNGYTYKPANGTFQMWTWDIDFTMGVGGHGTGQTIFDASPGTDGSSGGDPRIIAMWNTPAIRRAYLRAFEDIVNGPMNNSYMDPILDAKAAAMAANNVNYDPGVVTTIKNYTSGRRASLISQLGADVGNFFTAAVNGQANLAVSSNLVTITGTAPVGAKDIYINGVAVPVTWSFTSGTTPTTWTARVALSNGLNTLTVQGYTSRGTPTNTSRLLNITNNAVVADPVGNVVFNEILYQPAVPDTSFVELFNVSTTTAFDIGGWQINGLDFEFASGTVIAPRQYLIVAKSIPAFAFAYGFGISPVGEFDGGFDADGETLTLIKPATTNSAEVVIDKVRYEGQSPWPVIAANSGASLQLTDGAQDNSRVSNWTLSKSGNSPWRTFSTNINLGTTTGQTNLFIFLTGPGSVDIDNISIIAQTGPTASTDIIQNGGFESPLAGTWTAAGTQAGSSIGTLVADAGTASLHLVASAGGSPTIANSFWQATPILTNTIYTLRYRYIPTTNASVLVMRFTSGARPELNVMPGPPPPLSSPGAASIVIDSVLPPYDPVWLNELQAENPAGIADNLGQPEPWIELYNAGANTVSLSNYFLANNYGSNLTQWPFPADFTLAPGEFRVVWADGASGETSGTNAHTNFRLPIGNGTVALVRLLTNGAPQITDYLTYTNLRSGLSYGDFPDGQPFTRRVFQIPTGGGTNNSRDINVFINEWMAGNSTSIADPSDGQYDDWFELYNAGDTAVDLGNYYLTDNLGQRTKYRIPNNRHYTIQPGGFLLVWADNDSADNSTNLVDLHVNFSLNAILGEAIGLYASDGVTAIDAITFGPQTDNISEGRYSDGATNRYFMTMPTPRAANVISGGNTPPMLDPIADRTIRLGQSVNFTATATDAEAPPQVPAFSLGGTLHDGASMNASGQFSWTPTLAQAPSTNIFTVIVTDNGPGLLSDMGTFTVTVLPPPVAMITANGSTSVTVSFDTIPGRSYRLGYKLHIDDTMWMPLSAPVLATGTSLTIEDMIGTDPQRFYKVQQTD